MSTALLSLLLLVLVGIGLMMGAKMHEAFTNPPPTTTTKVSPALYNATITAELIEEVNTKPVTYDKLARDTDIAAVANQASLKAEQEERRQHRCPKCPDMSQYVKLSEVPCWNCTLP